MSTVIDHSKIVEVSKIVDDADRGRCGQSWILVVANAPPVRESY